MQAVPVLPACPIRSRRVSACWFLPLLYWASVAIAFASHAPDARSQIVRVKPPTGNTQLDHRHIVSALHRAHPGDTVRFARGTYVVGEIITVATPHLTLEGSPHGTVLRGCTPDGYRKLARDEKDNIRHMGWSHGRPHPSAARLARELALVRRCGMFQLTGGRDTVRHLTFEYTRLGLKLGYEFQQGYRPSPGGYRIEDNTFRYSQNGIRYGLSSPLRSVVERNLFVDTYHAVSAGGSRLYILDNTVLAPSPWKVPASHFPGPAIAVISIIPNAREKTVPALGRCNDNVIAGNLIEDVPSGISMTALPGTTCSGNVIRDNTIAVRRAYVPKDTLDPIPAIKPGSHFIDTPLILSADSANGHAGRIGHNRIERNRILGAEGAGIVLVHASANRVLDNTVVGVIRKKPDPHRPSGHRQKPSPGNGAGIWIMTGSDRNRLTGNGFQDIAGPFIVLQGNHNTVRIHSDRDKVRDLGTGNRITDKMVSGTIDQ